MNGITEIWEAVSRKADELFEWAQAHPKSAYLFVAILLAFWLTGVLLRWKWACHWQFSRSETWIFDDCTPETRRRIQIVLVSIAIIGCLTMFFAWR